MRNLITIFSFLAAGCAMTPPAQVVQSDDVVGYGHGGKRHVVVVGSAVFVPAGAQVRFENGARPTTILQVFAGPGPAAKYDSWKPMKGE